jgi:hypothetical protein
MPIWQPNGSRISCGLAWRDPGRRSGSRQAARSSRQGRDRTTDSCMRMLGRDNYILMVNSILNYNTKMGLTEIEEMNQPLNTGGTPLGIEEAKMADAL